MKARDFIKLYGALIVVLAGLFVMAGAVSAFQKNGENQTHQTAVLQNVAVVNI
jgi:hypothetical protein